MLPSKTNSTTTTTAPTTTTTTTELEPVPEPERREERRRKKQPYDKRKIKQATKSLKQICLNVYVCIYVYIGKKICGAFDSAQLHILHVNSG